MQEELFGLLVVRMGFAKAAEGKRIYGREARLIAFHGTLEETKAQYRDWLNLNPQLANMVHGTFECRVAVHQSEL